MSFDQITEYLGEKSDSLLNHTCTTIPKERLHLPGGDFLQKDICPLQPMSSREVEVRSIGEATLSSINELADFLGENLSMLEEQLDIVEKEFCTAPTRYPMRDLGS